MRKCLLSILCLLIYSIAILSSGCGAKEAEFHVSVDPDSVLSVIPDDVNGLIYIRNPLALNEEINALLAELVQGDPPQEIIAGILADTFGAGFESLEELGELGLDLGRDFCVFFAGTKPLDPCAAVHVKDPEAIRLVIDAESDVGNTVEYNGMTYNTTEEGGAFVILGDFLVYSRIPAVCEKAIDTHMKAMPSIGMNADYASLKLDPSLEQNDIMVYFPMAPIVGMLSEAAHGMKSGLDAMAAAVPDPAGLAMASNMMDFGIRFINQATTLSLIVELNGTDLQISPFLKFKEGSEAQTYFRNAPTELTHLEYLPQTSAANVLMQFEKETWIDLTVDIMMMLVPSDPNADNQGIEDTTQEFFEVLFDFYEHIGEQASGSFNYSGSLMPDMVFINDIVNEKQVATYMEEDYLTYIAAAASLYKSMGATDAANMYAGASAGPTEVYNDVEIMSFTLPNVSAGFAQMPPDMAALIPEKWDIYYAISEGKLLTSLSASTQPIKDALDRIAGVGIAAENGIGHGKVIDTLTLKNNWMCTISLITLIKEMLQVLAQSDPQAGPFLQMLFQNTPESHSIGIAGQNRDGGVQINVIIALAELKDLINMGTAMQQMMQMQEMQPMQ